MGIKNSNKFINFGGRLDITNITNLRISVVLSEHITSLVCLRDWLKA